MDIRINDFFLFGSGFSPIPVCVSSGVINFEIAGKIAQGDFKNINFPLVFTQLSGRKWTDVLNPSSVSLYLISDKLVELLEQNKITGWLPYKIRIFDKNDNEIYGYSGLSITGRCGEPDFNKSEIIEKRLVSNGPLGRYYKGLYIDLDQWDGSDFFIPNGTLHIIVTKKVEQLIQKHRVSNITLQNLTDFEISEFALKQ